MAKVKKKGRKLKIEKKYGRVDTFISRNQLLRQMNKRGLVISAVFGWALFATLISLLFWNRTATIVIGCIWFFISGNIVLSEIIRKRKIQEKLYGSKDSKDAKSTTQ